MKKSTLAALVLSCIGLFGNAAQAAPVSAWNVTNPQGFSNGSWSFGDIFTVGSSDLLVTALGAFDYNADGFSTNGGIKMGIFRESDNALLASTNILSSDTLIGNYRFSDINDLVLNANTQYRVVAVSGNDLYNITTGLSFDPRITWNGYGYCNTTQLTSCNSFTGIERTWMANMLIDSIGQQNPVPEPSTLALLSLSLVAGVAIRRRRSLRK